MVSATLAAVAMNVRLSSVLSETISPALMILLGGFFIMLLYIASRTVVAA